MVPHSHRLLRLLRSRQGGDDLLRQLLKAQSATGGESTGLFAGGLTVNVRALGKHTAAETDRGDAA